MNIFTTMFGEAILYCPDCGGVLKPHGDISYKCEDCDLSGALV